MNEERIVKAVRGLMACGACPEWYEDCVEHKCPYVDEDPPGNMNCTNALAGDALALVKRLAEGDPEALRAVRDTLGGDVT